MSIETTVDTDVLVIGGGGAACRAAVAAHDAGARTMVVLKGTLGSAGATVAPGAGVAWQVADACAQDDSPEHHLRNILDAGLGMADPRLARLLAYEIVERTAEMERWGLRFAPDPTGRQPHFTAYSCFGDRMRAHSILNSGHGHAGDIIMVLQRQMEQRSIPVHENVFVTDLVVHDGACCGAVALGPEGQGVLYRAGAVVLGAGGARQIFPPAGAHRIDTTGDGYAMALRAGATLTNMEFTQFMLSVVNQVPMAVVGSFWALYPHLRNRAGEEVLTRYLPAGITREQALWERTLHAPFSCRDASGWLDIAITTELREGRGVVEGGMPVDFSEVDLRRFVPSRPMHLPRDESQQTILPERPLVVRDTAHAINGGLCIDESSQSTLLGLFAAGEVAAGAHGADRLGGGMVTNCQVFGARAGRFAAAWAQQASGGELGDADLAAPLARWHSFGRAGRDAEEVLGALQRVAGRNLMVVRNAAGLHEVLDTIQELRRDGLPQVGVGNLAALRRAMEVENCLLTAELMASAALERRESRGSHYREDFPQRDDTQWGRNILHRLDAGELTSVSGELSKVP